MNSSDRSGFSALSYAAWRGPIENVAWLLSKGADPNLVTRGKSAEVLTNAIQGRDRRIFELLLEAGAKAETVPCHSPALDTAALYGLEYYTQRLLTIGADPDTKTRSGFPVLMSSVRGKNFKVLQMLVDAGANVNITDSGHETALDIAYEIKRKDMIRLLESAGAKRGKELSKPPAPDPAKEPVWDLDLDSYLGAELSRWAPRVGNSTVRLGISCDHALHGCWSVEYRLRRGQTEELEWKKMFPGSPRDDEDEDAEIYEAEIRLEPGATWIELRLSTELHKEPEELLDWEILVPDSR